MGSSERAADHDRHQPPTTSMRVPSLRGGCSRLWAVSGAFLGADGRRFDPGRPDHFESRVRRSSCQFRFFSSPLVRGGRVHSRIKGALMVDSPSRIARARDRAPAFLRPSVERDVGKRRSRTTITQGCSQVPSERRETRGLGHPGSDTDPDGKNGV